MSSRVEELLAAAIDGSGTDGLDPPQSRNEKLLFALNDKLDNVKSALAGKVDGPADGQAYQQLVTDVDGNTQWEDRLAYETEPVLTEIVPEQEFMGERYELSGESGLILGQTYTVKFDNTEYECICVDLGGALVIGNAAIIRMGSDTGEPFLLAYADKLFRIFVVDETNTHTVSVSGLATSIVKIPAKFIDKNSSGYIVIHNSSTMTQQEAKNYRNEISRNEVVFIIWGSLCIKRVDFGGTTGHDLQLTTQNGEVYLITKNADGLFAFSDKKFSTALLPGGRGPGDRTPALYFNREKIFIGQSTIHAGVGSTDTVFQVQPNGTKSKSFNVLGNGEAVTPALILYSSTADSTKKFRITVDDTGTISATEVT